MSNLTKWTKAVFNCINFEGFIVVLGPINALLFLFGYLVLDSITCLVINITTFVIPLTLMLGFAGCTLFGYWWEDVRERKKELDEIE